MTKIIKEMLPPDVRVARDCQDLLIECCVEFINLISSESNEVCNKEDKRTIAPEHVLKALEVLGFGEYIEEVYAAYEQHKFETMVVILTSMAKSIQDLSSKKKEFHWTAKVSNEEAIAIAEKEEKSDAMNEGSAEENPPKVSVVKSSSSGRRKLQAIAVSRLKSMIGFGRNRGHFHGLGTRLVGTLFGYRRGHVHFAFQKDPTSHPVFLVELATPITGLVREMASGLVRIALECDKDDKKAAGGGASCRLIDQAVWRTYCNGKKCGFATRRECGAKEWQILKAVEPISMGAGVLPAAANGEGEVVMYMRAKFERVVGSRDSEAFYMMNPDSNAAPELSIYLLRV
nr:protein MIZU-KUSSEI 1 [Ipomoea batatas]